MPQLLKALFFGILLICFRLGHAQDSLLLLNEVKNFGTVAETEGPISHTFRFINHYQEPVAVSDVQVSCGCTIPSWSDKMVLPSDTGSVTIVFNPYNRPGPFEKQVTLITHIDSAAYDFTIKGYVKPSPASLEAAFPFQYGQLRFPTKTINLGHFKNDTIFTKHIEFYNAGNTPVQFESAFQHPAHMAISIVPMVVQPGERGTINLQFDPGDYALLGFNQNHIAFSSKDGQAYSFTTIATVEEYFPPMEASALAMAPKLLLDQSQYDFDRVREGDVLSHIFKLENAGKQELAIRKITTNCGCTVAAVDTRTIAAGASTSLVVQFDTSGRRGSQIKTISLFTNDPLNPIQTLVVRAYVETE